MKVLIHDDRTDGLDFLLENIISHGYRAGIARNKDEILNMLLEGEYNVVLTNGGYHHLDPDHLSRIKSSSVLIINIRDQRKGDAGPEPEVDLHLERPFEAAKLWKAICYDSRKRLSH